MELLNSYEYINLVVKNLLKDKCISDAKVEHSPGSEKGDNYVGEITRVSISHENLTESWIFKLPNKNPKLRENSKMSYLYEREIYCYEKLFPVLDTLQDELTIQDEGRFKHAKCLYTNQKEYHEVIVMEDLTEKGYSTIKKTDTFTWEMLQLTIKTMANLHALSFILKVRKPGEFLRICDEFKWKHPTARFVTLEDSMRQCKELIIEKTHKERFEKFILNLREKICDCLEKTTSHSVIIQGDSWIKNLMFKFENNKPVDLILIDWQVSRISSPVVDLILILFLNTSVEIRRQYMKATLDLYYDHLAKRLNSFGLNIDKCYPKDIFEEDMKSYSIYGIAMGLMGSLFIHEDNDLGEVQKETDFRYSSKCIKQINDILTDCIDFGFI